MYKLYNVNIRYLYNMYKGELMITEQEYLEMLRDTGDLIAEEKAKHLGEVTVAVTESAQLTNEVEFWRWMGKNYPRNLGTSEAIQQTAVEKAQWLKTQLQGKGYEWDYMATQRMKPSKIFSSFEAGDCPTQPGIDITEKGILDNSVKGTFQNKAYLSSNNPDLHNTPKDALVVTNKEKVPYVKKQGYQTESYMDSQTIKKVKDKRYDDALMGKTNTAYSVQNILASSAKAGVIGAVIGITTETIMSYKKWKNKQITDQEYLFEIAKSGGEAGVTAGLTSAAMIPVQSAITIAGASTLLTIPVAFVFGSVINSVIAPCFGKGKYKKILQEVKYYQALETVYADFLNVVENSAKQYGEYITHMAKEKSRFESMKELNSEIDNVLEKIYKSI